MFLVDLTQIVYLALLLVIGGIVLFLRRKAKGTKSLYKLVLILLGVLLAVATLNKQSLIQFDQNFLKNLSVLLLIILMFELSIRLNPENISFKKKNILIFFLILIANFLIISVLTTILLGVNAVYSMIFAIIISSIEYFTFDELKEEGDLANPLLILFAFSLLFFYNLDTIMIESITSFVQYILIGLGTGVAAGIIVFKSMKNQDIKWFHEVGLLAVAIVLYVLTSYLGGSGLFAILILGVFFGNSFVRKRSDMKSFSPFIFKSLEILLFLLIGFVVIMRINADLVLKSLMIFIAYLIIRFVIINILYKHFSMQNKIFLTFAPKGMAFAAVIIVLGSYGTVSDILISVMLLILIFSLIISSFLEYYENKKINRLEKIYNVLKRLRFGRKSSLPRRNISLFNIFKRKNKKILNK